MICVDRPIKKKWTGRGTSHQLRTKAPHDVEASGDGSATLFPRYIPPRKDDSPSINISNNSKYLLVKPSIPKGVHVTVNILSNIKNMGFIEHDLWKFHELVMSWYMTFL